MRFPTEYRYTKDHEWAKIEGNEVTVGITDHAQSALGDVVYVELPETGKELKEKQPFGVVESIKAVSDLYAPITGRVTEVNSALINDPSTLNREPHGAAWLIKMELTDPSTLEDLMSADEYSRYVETLK